MTVESATGTGVCVTVMGGGLGLGCPLYRGDFYER